MIPIDQALKRLAESDFRRKFHLSDEDRQYIDNRGMDVIRMHAADFVARRLAPSKPRNDGKQTPTHGHPVFVAQHACACCCRGCLYKWHKIPEGVALSQEQQDDIVALLMAWIQREYTKA